MSISYRPEIDGLRAISVVAIIIYHAEFVSAGQNLIIGGFLGVDVFFVISGFLITSLILKELNSPAGFSILNFYERRVRRLLPALLAMLTLTALAAWFVLLPAQLLDFAYSLAASLLFVSNFYWDFSLQQYGADSGLLKPLLHTWTLAVEEQFYIIFPLLCAGIFRWFRHIFIWLFIGLFLLGLGFAHWYTGINPHSAFYSLATRFWELMAGAILAASMPHLQAIKVARPLWGALNTLGLLMIMGSFLTLNLPESHHPGLITVLTVAGTTLVIGFSGGGDLVTRLLSSRPFVAIGLVSYSLYLWHFPIFALARNYQSDISILDKLAWIALSSALAVISYKLIEKPCRNRENVSLRRLSVLVIGGSLLLLSFSVYVIQDKGGRHRFSNLELLYGINEFDTQILKAKSYNILGSLAEQQGFEASQPLKPSQYESSQRWYSSDASTHKVLIVGVSSSMDLFNAFHLNRERFPGYEFARFGISKELPEKHVSDLMESPNFQDADSILLYMALNGATVERYQTLVKSLHSSGKDIILVSHPAAFKTRDNQQLFDWFLTRTGNQQLGKEEDLNRLFFKERDRRSVFLDVIVNAEAEKLELPFLDMWSVVCNDTSQSCTAITPEGYRTYYDHVHWTVEGAKFFGERIADLGWL